MCLSQYLLKQQQQQQGNVQSLRTTRSQGTPKFAATLLDHCSRTSDKVQVLTNSSPLPFSRGLFMMLYKLVLTFERIKSYDVTT